jgi:sec-independent protein translocase protein TatB
MFDIGALELVLIGVVALLVVGPERLPKVARTAGVWLGRGRRAFLSIKDEIDREIKADELKEILRKQAESNPLESIIEDSGALRSGQKGARPAEAGKPRPDADRLSSQSAKSVAAAKSGDDEP